MEQDELIPLYDLCRYYDVEFDFVAGLSEYELLEVIHIEQVPCLRKSHLSDFEKILRLHYELDINMAGIDAIVHLLRKIKHLQGEIHALQLRADSASSNGFTDVWD